VAHYPPKAKEWTGAEQILAAVAAADPTLPAARARRWAGVADAASHLARTRPAQDRAWRCG